MSKIQLAELTKAGDMDSILASARGHIGKIEARVKQQLGLIERLKKTGGDTSEAALMMVRLQGSFYRFYFMNHGCTVAAEVLECNSDGAALEKAKELFSERSVGTTVVWQGTRKVGIIERN